MVKAKKERAHVRVLDRKKVPSASALRVVLKGGKQRTFKVSKPAFNGKRIQLVLQDEDGRVVMVTSLYKLARDIEEYFKKQGLEPLYIYPAFQQTLLSE
jgi:NADPH-dependent ferric siderophore reductase